MYKKRKTRWFSSKRNIKINVKAKGLGLYPLNNLSRFTELKIGNKFLVGLKRNKKCL